jgi:solute:Na+ symporter, SSS family
MIDALIIVFYLVLILVIGLLAGRGIKNISQFSLGNHSFSWVVIFATLSASFMGGGFTMGVSSRVFTFGILSVVGLWGFSAKELIIAKFFAPKMEKFRDSLTIGDIMATQYGRQSKIITGFFSVIVCAGVVGAQVGAMGYIFQTFLNIPKLYGVLIGSSIVIAYTSLGGIRAIVRTDVLQFAILAIGIPLTLVFGVIHVGGVAALVDSVPPESISLVGNGKSFFAAISLFFTFLLGETLVPPYVQRLLIGKNAKHTAKGTMASGLFSIFYFTISGLIGLVALAMAPDLEAGTAMPYVIKTVLPLGIKGLVVAGIISAVMSTADSFLHCSAVAFVHDLIKPLRKKEFSGNQELLWVKITTLLIGILAIIFAVKFKSLIDMCIYAWSFWSPIILVPLAALILGYKASQKTFFISGIMGGATVIIWANLLKCPFGIDGLIIGVVVNLIVFSICHKKFD